MNLIKLMENNPKLQTYIAAAVSDYFRENDRRAQYPEGQYNRRIYMEMNQGELHLYMNTGGKPMYMVGKLLVKAGSRSNMPVIGFIMHTDRSNDGKGLSFWTLAEVTGIQKRLQKHMRENITRLDSFQWAQQFQGNLS